MNETSAEVAQPYVRSRAEKFFLGGLIVGALSAGIIFLALTAWSIFMPPMGIALLFGIVVATLAYAFLGARATRWMPRPRRRRKARAGPLKQALSKLAQSAAF
jgi:uncharacterized membrane protein YccC